MNVVKIDPELAQILAADVWVDVTDIAEPLPIRRRYYKPNLSPDAGYVAGSEAHEPTDEHPANIVSSLCTDGQHRPALDIDVRHERRCDETQGREGWRMMGRRPTKSGDEVDAVTRWRHVLIWRAGQRSATKRRIRRRERREAVAAWSDLCDDVLDVVHAAELGYDPDACRRDTEWNMYRRADEEDEAAS